ncbi:MAG: ATP-binding protein [Anaerolineaceae bacterium]|nr:ATP-binding protein [Anaerolineaceae bacterium]
MSQDSSRASLTLLYDISREFVTSLDLNTVLSRVLSLSTSNVGAERGMLIVLDDDKKPIDAAIVYQGELIQYTEKQLGNILTKGLAGWVLRSHDTVYIPDTSKDERWVHRPDDDVERSGSKSAICIPILRALKHLVGVLTIVHPEPGFFDDEKLALLQAIADQAGIAIHNARLFNSLEMAHLRYRELFEDSIDPIIITNWEGDILEANRRAARSTGIDIYDLHRHTILELHDVNWEILGNQFENLRTGYMTLSYESELHISDRSDVLPIEVFIHKVHIDNADFLQWTLRDISERKELDELRDELIAMIYHDLRSPLSNVVSSLDMLKTLLPAFSDPSIIPIFNIAMRSTDRVKRLATSLLDINRLEAGQSITQQKALSIYGLVVEAFESISPNIKAKKQTINNDLPEGLPDLYIDEDMVRRILINLLENANKFTPMKGHISLGGCKEDKFIKLWVQDSGSGIPPDAGETIFDKFSRIEDNKVPKGIGLGLTFCRLAVEAHGGKIWVDSKEGEGSQFIFTLPMAMEI